LLPHFKMKTLICVFYLILGTAVLAQQTYTGNLLLYNGKGQVVDRQSQSFTANIGPFGWLTPGASYGGSLSNLSYTSPSSGTISITGTLKLYDSQGNLVASQFQMFSTDLGDIGWLANGQTYLGTIQNWSYTAPSPPTPTPPSLTPLVAVHFAWDNDDTIYNVTSYRLYYGTESRVYTQSVDVGAATGVTVSFIPGLTYYAAVTAYNGLESPYSNEISFNTGQNPGSR
jgi:hypothetical protein